MTGTALTASSTISVFTRHSGECSQRGNPQGRRCNCRKSIYIYEHGKVRYVSAKTRSWEQAERAAQAERDKRNPIKIELLKIAENEAAKEASEAAKATTLKAAFEQFLGELKTQRSSSLNAYRSTTRRLQRWADEHKLKHVGDVTGQMLDKWRSEWGPEARKEEDRLALTTQSALLTRVKAFFAWATGILMIDHNPALALKAITPGESDTMPLAPRQYEEVLEATGQYDFECRYNAAKVGQQLRAIFLIQRWTGLRIGDLAPAKRIP